MDAFRDDELVFMIKNSNRVQESLEDYLWAHTLGMSVALKSMP